MSQHKNKKLEIVTELHTDEEPIIDTDDDDAQTEALSPLTEIMLDLETVVTGGSAQKLRLTVQRVFPKKIDEAQDFLKQLQRLRSAAEAVAQVGQEQYAALAVKLQS